MERKGGNRRKREEESTTSGDETSFFIRRLSLVFVLMAFSMQWCFCIDALREPDNECGVLG